ncbi:TPA: hypothetical protein I3M21_004370 [Salmonella enterica]|nr:hypothetical protein [Salmonella enterica]HAR9009563.1 hypothetical protein [Salmonella enterica]HAR9319066.1 hypothetical protein [Salmonella enterica]
MAKIDVVCPRSSKLIGLSEMVISAQVPALSLYSMPEDLPVQLLLRRGLTRQAIVDMTMNSSGCRDTARVLRINLNTVLHRLKTYAESASAKCRTWHRSCYLL